MKELSTFVFHTVVMFIIANLMQFLFEYIGTQTINFNMQYEMLYIFVSLLWGLNIYMEFAEELSRALGNIVKIILHFVFGYFGIFVALLTFYGIDTIEKMFLITTIVYIFSFIICGGIISILVKKMSYYNAY